VSIESVEHRIKMHKQNIYHLRNVITENNKKISKIKTSIIKMIIHIYKYKKLILSKYK